MYPASPHLPKRTLWKIHKGQDFHELNKLGRSIPVDGGGVELETERLRWSFFYFGVAQKILGIQVLFSPLSFC